MAGQGYTKADDKEEEKSILNLLKEESKSNSRNSITSLIISIAALTIAIISLWFTYKNDNVSGNYQNNQLNLLKEIKVSIDSLNKNTINKHHILRR